MLKTRYIESGHMIIRIEQGRGIFNIEKTGFLQRYQKSHQATIVVRYSSQKEIMKNRAQKDEMDRKTRHKIDDPPPATKGV
jgi:hypothetical protein